MATAYIYNVDSNEIIVTIQGDDEKSVQSKVEELGYMGMDEYGLTYSDHGLIETTSTELVEA